MMSKKLIKAFAGYTTFHGLGFIVLPGSSLRRRLIWMFLFTMCMSLMMYQAVDRVTYFHSHPVTVNYRTIYNSSLRFPAVTICNLNKHKASNAEELGMYDLLKNIYSESANVSLLKPEHENITWEEVQLKTAHRKEDLIHSCRLGERKCSHEDFNMTVTDHGVCYTFNKDGVDEYLVSLQGSKHGLQLTLNAEEYEYIPDTYTSVGVKMLVHRQGEAPLMKSLGRTLGVDEYTSIGLKKTIAKNLPKPHGVCENKELQLYEKYILSNCDIECRTKRAVERCGCRLPFMAGTNEFSKPCTIREYVTCMRNTVDILERDQCDCPVPCYQEMHEPETFDASVSELAVKEIVTTVGKEKLCHDIMKGEESLYRMENETWHSLVESYREALHKFTAFVEHSNKDVSLFQQKLNTLSQITSVNKAAMKNIWYILHNTKKAMDDLSKNISPFVTTSFLRTMENRIRRLMTNENQEILYNIVLDTLRTANETINQYKHKYTVFPSVESIKGDLDGNLEKLLEQLDVFIELAGEAYHNRSVNESTFADIRQKYIKYVDNITASIEDLDINIKFKDNFYTLLMKKFEENYENIKYNVKNMRYLETDLKTIGETVQKLNVVRLEISQITQKRNIVEKMTSEEVENLKFELDGLTQIVDIHERINAAKMWIKNQAKGQFLLCRKRTFFEIYDIGTANSTSLKSCYEVYRKLFVNFRIQYRDDYTFPQLQEALERLIRSSKDFTESIEINSNFIRKNFLQVDIFFRTMGYEAVDQQEGYSFFALLCDIGGSMGLLIGGSVLSLFEVIDLIIRQAYFKRKKHLEEIERKKTEDNRHW